MNFPLPNILFTCKKIYTKSILISLLSFHFLLFNFQAKSQVVINEVGIGAAKDQGTGGEFIELFNRSGCSVDISCYVLVYSGTTYRAAGWSVAIPSGTILASGKYYLIGGHNSNFFNPFGTASWQNGVKGSIRTFVNSYGTNGNDLADLDLGTEYTSGKDIIIGNLINAGGQITLFKSDGSIASAISYNNGNNSGTYPAILNNSSGCISNSISNPNNIITPPNRNATFNSYSIGLYLDANGNYQPTFNDPNPGSGPTPGKPNNTNGLSTQTVITPAPTPTIYHN